MGKTVGIVLRRPAGPAGAVTGVADDQLSQEDVGHFVYPDLHGIEKELVEEMDESFKRLESIIVELISQQKKIQIEQRGIERSFKALVEIIAKMSGNGLRERILRIQEKKNDG